MAGTLTVDNANTDTIAGKSNANIVNIKGEGSATTNLQQGWLNIGLIIMVNNSLLIVNM